MSPKRNPSVAFEDDVIDRLARIEQTLEGINGQRADHETRIRQLERRQWILPGIAIALGPVLNRLGVHLPILN